MAERADELGLEPREERRRVEARLEDPDRRPGRARGRCWRSTRSSLDSQTKEAEVDRRGRRDPRACPAATSRCSTSGDRQPARRARRSCSCTATSARCTGGTSWRRSWPRDHRVIRIDLLGHGGSAEALERLRDRGPGRRWSPRRSTELGRRRARSSSATRWAARSRRRSPSSASQLVDRVVDHRRRRPTTASASCPSSPGSRYTPVIGEAMWRLDAGLRDRGRLRGRVRARLRPRRRLRRTPTRSSTTPRR